MEYIQYNDTHIESIPIFSTNMELLNPTSSSDLLPDYSFRKWASDMLRNESLQVEPDPVLSTIKSVLSNMRIYYTPAIVVFGVFGNTLIWIMLLFSKLRQLSSTHYMAAMVIVNTMHLVALLIQWLTLFGIDLYNTPGFCQFVSFINNLCVFLSIWFVVAFSVDRYIANVHPQHTPIMCTTLRAKVVIIGLSLVGFVVYMNISLTVGVINLKGKSRCSPLPMFLHNLRILTVFDMLVNIIIPYTSILCIDIILMKCHWEQHHKLQGAYMPRSPSMDDIRVTSGESNNNDSESDTTQGWRTERMRTTNMFTDQMHVPMRKFAIIYLTFFLVTHLPSEMFRLIHTAKGLVNPYYMSTKWEYYLQVISQHMFNTSLASHICLFLLFHKYFYEGLVNLVLACVHKLQMSYLVVKAPRNDLPMNSNEMIASSQQDSHTSISVTFV